MRGLIWRAVARIASQPRVARWLIARAQRTPYTHITSADGQSVYMGRWWLFNAYRERPDGGVRSAPWEWLGLPSIRVHHIRRADQDRHLHDHPWNARTIVLAGSYVEVRPGGAVHVRDTGYTGRLLFGQFHRIDSVSEGGVWTLFFTWRYRGTWGFDVDGRKVPYREYLNL
ncbi:MAG: hypothetical protein EOO54_08365 [Haliea sp.]|nr:MAG: hypothetical protein EOO54_08365 [Haliea sp.]